MEPIYEYFKSQFGLGALVAIICVAALIYATWFVASRYARFKDKTDNLPCERHEEEINKTREEVKKMEVVANNLPCVHHEEEINHHRKDMQKMEVSVSKIETRVEDMYEMLKMMAGTSPSSRLTQSHSPISLTPLGHEIAKELDFKSILANNWQTLEPIVKDEKNPYDIQMEFIAQLIAAPEKYIDRSSMDKIKKDAFFRGLPLIDYMRMLGILARDEYFSRHNIDINEVDTN